MDIHKSRLFAESWNVAYRKKSTEGFPKDLASPFIVIRNSYRYWAADPFIYEDGEDTYIFAELYDYIKKRGVIGYCKIGSRKVKWIPVIQEEYHLSFPFLYSDSGHVFLLPESSSSESVYCYRAAHFPDKWEKKECFLRDVRYVDTTPFCAFGKRLALTYDLKQPALRILSFDEGKDYVADSSSPELKRPAGYINPQLQIRAAQNCEEDYGKGLIFYHFFLGKDLSYHEEEICRVMPEEVRLSRKIYLDGMHTYQCSSSYEVIDIKTRRLNLLNLLVRVVSKLKGKD